LTAQYVAQHYKIDAIYASDLKRAYKTASCLGELVNLEVTPMQALREINAGEWEGVTFEELPVRFPESYGVWREQIGLSICPGGESVKQLGERVMNALTLIAEANDGKTVAIGTHATPIRAMQSIIETGGVESMQAIPWVSNASVTVLTYENKTWKLVVVGEDRHLTGIKTSLSGDV